ncbi:hypothetical protein KJ815_14405, partial [bacterium]|nr:hypothetical protein [bacterium]
KQLARNTACRPTEVLYKTNLLEDPDGEYEVRDIRVELGSQAEPKHKIQHLIFTFSRQGIIDDVRFALESHLYPEIIREGRDLEDAIAYNKIYNFLEVFRTAYNRKDLDYITKVYSDSALIIVGRVVKDAPKGDDFLTRTSLTGEQIQFVRRSKKQYVEQLSRAFTANEYISVEFEEVGVLQHHLNPRIFGVNLEQSWKSSNYSDHGYLFLMFDFSDERNPLVHVRSWQPVKFEDGSVISLGDFIIVGASDASTDTNKVGLPEGSENKQ